MYHTCVRERKLKKKHESGENDFSALLRGKGGGVHRCAGVFFPGNPARNDQFIENQVRAHLALAGV